MANGVDVNIGADTRDFDRAVKSGMVAPVEDAQGALDEYAKAGTDAGGTLERTFQDQQRQTTELKHDIDQLNRTIRDGSGPAYRERSQQADSFKRHSTEGFDEIKDSARSNAIEVGASFTGGFDQALGGLQGFVAEFLAGFGPGGIIAGVGAAALLGLVTQAITEGQQAADAQKASVAALAGEYVDAGDSGRRTFDSVSQSIKNMATSDGSDVIITLQKALDKATVAGADYQQIVQAIATESPREIGQARLALEQLRAEQLRNVKGAADYAKDPNASLRPKILAVGQLADALDQAESQAKQAARAEELAARAGLSDWRRQHDLINQVEGAYDDAAGAAEDFFDKHGKFKPGAYIANMEKVRAELKHYKDDLAEADLSPAAQHFLEQQGAETAAAMLRGYRQATPNQQAQLGEIWTTAGTENATSYKEALGRSLKGVRLDPPIMNPPVVPAPDTSMLDAFVRTPYVKRVVVDVYARNGQRIG